MSEPTGGADRVISLMDGSAALPRKNGDLVFQAPWEGRVFGMAVSLCDALHYDWEDFRRRLIAAIAAREAEPPVQSESFPYYECWLQALERLVVEHGLLSPSEIDARTEAFATGDRDEF